MKGVMRFDKKGKLGPRYVGPYMILQMVGKAAYELDLPADLAAVHLIFHIFLLMKCVGDLASIVPLESVAMKNSLAYEESVEGAIWEAEAALKAKYPHLYPFDSVSSFALSHLECLVPFKYRRILCATSFRDVGSGPQHPDNV
ncbi:hypothetical protein MTR67_001952 [Solanum verrucosum]|uniref:Tf2-1-like SH3-like domain-containing protein n=1 Tax=Solanum verrucosum TaxID=315347 RepID=A0AAF0PQ38_SOLVR|nr:hypothetical protein MTR67_001952 [Solanum verrucosum]